MNENCSENSADRAKTSKPLEPSARDDMPEWLINWIKFMKDEA